MSELPWARALAGAWSLDEDVRLPYIGDRRIVYVDGNRDLVARNTPLTPRTFGWSQWLANDHGNGCRSCAP